MKKNVFVLLLSFISIVAYAQKKSELKEEIEQTKTELEAERNANELLKKENIALQKQILQLNSGKNNTQQTIDSLRAEINVLNLTIAKLDSKQSTTANNTSQDSSSAKEMEYLKEQLYTIKIIQEHLEKTIIDIENKMSISPPTPEFILCISGKSFQPLYSEYLDFEITLDKENGIFGGNIHTRQSREIGKIQEKDSPISGTYSVENGKQILRFETINYKPVNIIINIDGNKVSLVKQSTTNEVLQGTLPTFTTSQTEFNYYICN